VMPQPFARIQDNDAAVGEKESECTWTNGCRSHNRKVAALLSEQAMPEIKRLPVTQKALLAPRASRIGTAARCLSK